ncbi:MAG: GAF domain-containing protein, partial [Candidatus Acidiferrales bacterium]
MDSSSALFELASVSLACRDQDTLLKMFAARAGATLGARTVLIWLRDAQSEELLCRARWNEPGERASAGDGAVSEGILAEVFESGETRRLNSREAASETFEHLQEASRAHIKSALYAALPAAQSAAGVVEVLNKRSGDFTEDEAHFLQEASRLAGQALTNLEAIETERRAQLATLERLTALYDLGRTFTSTLELAELLPIVAGKIRDILGGAACNLWLVDAAAQDLYLAQKSGQDPTTEDGARGSAEEGPLGEVLQGANPKLVEDPAEEEAFEERRAAGGD